MSSSITCNTIHNSRDEVYRIFIPRIHLLVTIVVLQSCCWTSRYSLLIETSKLVFAGFRTRSQKLLLFRWVGCFADLSIWVVVKNRKPILSRNRVVCKIWSWYESIYFLCVEFCFTFCLALLLLTCLTHLCSSLFILVLFISELSSFCASKTCGLIISHLQLNESFDFNLSTYWPPSTLTSSLSQYCRHSSLRIFTTSCNDFTSFNKVWICVSIWR